MAAAAHCSTLRGSLVSSMLDLATACALERRMIIVIELQLRMGAVTDDEAAEVGSEWRL